MTRYEDQSEFEAGYGASEQGDLEEAPEQAQPEFREPPTDEEAKQDDYAESDGDA
jgi:hypothetical protein